MMVYDSVVVGGGMAGLACALGLSQRGLTVAVIEAQSIPGEIKLESLPKRVSSINRASEKLLNQLGVWEEIVSTRASSNIAMEIWDQNTEAKLEINSKALSLPYLSRIIENDLIIAKLYTVLERSDVDIFENTTIQNIVAGKGQDQIIKLSTEQVLQCDLVIGADGGNSFIRNYFDFKCDQKPYGHHAIVANIQTEKPHNNVAYQRFLSNGVLAFLPLSEPNSCSIVYSVNSEQQDNLCCLEDNEFAEHLWVASSAKLGKIQLKSPRKSFELIERHAKSYYKKGVVLIADAGHTIHPLAGQGINLGLADVRALIQVLVESKSAKRYIGAESTLALYERKRRFDNQVMISSMYYLKQLFCNDYILLKPFLSLGLGAVNRSNLLKRFFIDHASGG